MHTVALLALSLMLPAQPASASTSPEEPAVRAAVNHYLQGQAQGSAEEFRAAFHDQARLFWVNAQGQLATWTREEYIQRAGTGAPAKDEAQRKRRIVFVDISGTAAVAKVELDYPSVHYIDYLSLLKVDGEWKVINKIFFAERRAS